MHNKNMSYVYVLVSSVAAYTFVARVLYSTHTNKEVNHVGPIFIIRTLHLLNHILAVP